MASLYCLVTMIFAAIFSGLVIAKLLLKDEPHHIRTLNDLRSMPNLKIIVKKKSWVEDLFHKSKHLQDLKSRVVIEGFDVSEAEALQKVLHQIKQDNFVLVDDKMNFLNYLRSMPQQGFYIDDFFFSEVINKVPAAWVLPKGTEVQI